MLTPKMSLRRNNVCKVYDAELQEMYSGKGGHRIKYPANMQHKE
jgi:hypothetical protein